MERLTHSETGRLAATHCGAAGREKRLLPHPSGVFERWMVSGKFYYKSGQERAGWERVDRGIDDGR
jgi:hypothetical protein